MHWYARQVANKPCLVIVSALLLALTSVFLALYLNDLPSFSEPLLGFEPRGTVLSERSTAWRNLLESTGWNGPLTFYPNAFNDTVEQGSAWPNGSPSPNRSFEGPWLELESGEEDSPVHEWDDEGRVVFERTMPLPPATLPAADRKDFFCNNPTRAYAHVIIQSPNNSNLFTASALRALCWLDEELLRSAETFPKLCEEKPWQKGCCRSWHLANYVALLRNRTTCHDIRDSDVRAVRKLLTTCAPHYHNMKLSHDCASEPALCRAAPRQCIEYDAVYNIMHYLVDIDFLNPDFPQPNLTLTAIFLPTARSVDALQYYRELESMFPMGNDLVQVAGMDLGLKYKLFSDYLLQDTVFVSMAGTLVFISLWLYSASFFVAFMTFFGVAFSVGTAYFMYTVVYQIHFFPFINVLTIVIIIGIGADDACLYCKLWRGSKASSNNGTLVKVVRDTLYHACLSMFVTSITTAVAFFASAVSHITAVRCFSIFAGTAVLANFLFTVLWLPASVIIAERWFSCLTPLYFPFCSALWRAHYAATEYSRIFFEKILPCIIIKYRNVWLVLLACVAAGGVLVVFYAPRLQLPDSKEFQIFRTDHPFEQYDLLLKQRFWFEKAREQDQYRKMPIRVVWGVMPIDSGSFLDPFDRGTLMLDSSFDASSPESQQWLLDFCVELRNQSFYQSTHGPMLFHCFIETFREWMGRRCTDGLSDADRTPCCETSPFPFRRDVFDRCVREAIRILHHTPGYFVVPPLEGVRFSRTTGLVQAIVVQYDSIYTFSNSYAAMDEFYRSVEAWVNSKMESAPPGMRNGWFTSDLDFYDLQESLAKGSLVAIGVAVAVSFFAMLLTTLNLLISVYAIVTIGCIISVTVASLVLLGWKLNVLESTTVSLSIGLAVDLTLHYGVAYRLSSREERVSSVVHVLGHVGSSVAMAAVTALLAGVVLFPSRVLAYLQIGTFLVLINAISWIFANFLFLPLLCTGGPTTRLSLQVDLCCVSGSPKQQAPPEKSSHALSESTLSSSSAPQPAPLSEGHELEPLTLPEGKSVRPHRTPSRKIFQSGEISPVGAISISTLMEEEKEPLNEQV